MEEENTTVSFLEWYRAYTNEWCKQVIRVDDMDEALDMLRRIQSDGTIVTNVPWRLATYRLESVAIVELEAIGSK